MNIAYDKNRNEYILGETRYSKEMFLAYIESDMLQSALVDKVTYLDVTDDKPEDGERLKGAENILLYGVPGVGKSYTIRNEYCANSKYMERVVFHPDYMYTDFVGQILPQIDSIDGSEKLKYAFVPGPFTKMLKKAWDDPMHYYYLIIEELNRGNAPAIFGEVFQLMDRKNRDDNPDDYGESEYGIANYDVANIVFDDRTQQIKIPSNLYVIATMNTADQNVFTLDTAFQRRWTMRHIKNDIDTADHADVRIEDSVVTWGAFAKVINDLIVDVDVDMVSSSDKRLGAYFVKKNELGKAYFPEKVLKYLWDDAFKMDKELIFNEDIKTLEMVIETYENATEDRLKAVLRASVYEKMLQKNNLGD